MALYSLRVRRALSLSSSLLHQHFHSPKLLSPLHSSPSALLRIQNPRTTPSFSEFESFRHFRSSPISLSSRNRRFESDDQMEITADTILFEGCDYNHWLITVDFPRDVAIPAGEKVQKYVEIAAGVFGSEEEAKKRIYACSTTTYEGFQVECSEETSEKFKENPAVVFVLPDSYIDPVNKEYGGDKYINGTIIRRPPPIMSARRNPRQSPRPQHQENWGSGPGDARNFGPQQTQPTQQNFGPQQYHPTQRNFSPQQNHATQQNFGPPRRPAPQQSYGLPQNTPPQQTYGQHLNASPQHNYGMPQNTTAYQDYGYHSPQHDYGQSYNYPNRQNYGPPQNFTPRQNYPRVGEDQKFSEVDQRNGFPNGQQGHFTPRQNTRSPGIHSPVQQNSGQSGGIEGPTTDPGAWDEQNYGQSGGIEGPTTDPGAWDEIHSVREDSPHGDQRHTSIDSGNSAGQTHTPSQGGTLHRGIWAELRQGIQEAPEYGQNYLMDREDQTFSGVNLFPYGQQRNFG